MKRSLPSTSSNKRKQQDAFGDTSAFFPSKGHDTVQPNGLVESAQKHASAARNQAATSEVLRGIRPRQSTSAKPQSLMAFSTVARLDKPQGQHNSLSETPSKASRLASPGLPKPSGFKLPTASITSLQSYISGPTVARGISTSKVNAGMSPLPSVMTPLSGLKAIGGVLKTDAQSPSTNLSRVQSLHSLPWDSDRSTSVKPESPLFPEAFSQQDSSRSKAQRNDDRNSLTRYLTRLVSKQQAASSLFLANLSLSTSNQTSRSRATGAETPEASGSAQIGPTSLFSTADIVVVVQYPLLPVQHTSPLFQCQVFSTGRNRSVRFLSVEVSDPILVSFSGNVTSGTGNLRGHIEPNRLASTMKQMQMHDIKGHPRKEIMAGIWEPWQEVSLGVEDGVGMPRVVLLCSRFVIMEM
ncbi:hypothetical protein NliqN6_4194 [Naganishia liquefaciens]|uniref:Uncharacterized protein n=1 Tax=Naganishia liquefaciens TaxID=104408 RepID=A0A8H3YH25_9TREE|nr:hypothetical protein NliqN6_4194 [Naganishia liquefaciens]